MTKHTIARRLFSGSFVVQKVVPLSEYSKGERYLHEKLNAALDPSKLVVMDISGGCGSMYAIEVSSKKFKDLSVMKQHKLVTEAIKEDIKGFHGVQIRTFVE